jgi:hypothetical protein
MLINVFDRQLQAHEVMINWKISWTLCLSNWQLLLLMNALNQATSIFAQINLQSTYATTRLVCIRRGESNRMQQRELLSGAQSFSIVNRVVCDGRTRVWLLLLLTRFYVTAWQ